MEILTKLKADELDVQNVRGQGYDNGANMSGKYHGVQAVILNKNNLATFIPCAAHCLNLSGVHAASPNGKVQFFFDVIQKIYTFFVKSTTRWKILMDTLKISLKGHSDTRWASKAQAVKAMNSQIKEVFKVLQNISDSELNLETKSTAKNLLQLINFDFLCLLNIWNQILSSIDRVNQALQNKSLSLEKSFQFATRA
ncbi:zinc finger MYM-type protein 1-like [Sipha flava]|uniref:Zinc finger MYM-type protein 1-like n=1 Tax=Sipha flava TaxID=143950 RepID=A0A8B8FUX2_9HEMI|nr:zinc finger MYM-type protein 1-like [Sipha flava]